MVYGLHKKLSCGTTTRFIQRICAGISLTGSEWDVGGDGGGGYMVAPAPLFVQKSSMWPPHGRVPCLTDSSKSASAQIQWENMQAALCWLLCWSLRSCMCAHAWLSSDYTGNKFQSAKKWKVQRLDLVFSLSHQINWYKSCSQRQRPSISGLLIWRLTFMSVRFVPDISAFMVNTIKKLSQV